MSDEHLASIDPLGLLYKYEQEIDHLTERAEAAEARLAQLELYVQHKSGCDIWAHFRGSIKHGTVEQISGPCSCGLAALVRARPAQEPEKTKS